MADDVADNALTNPPAPSATGSHNTPTPTPAPQETPVEAAATNEDGSDTPTPQDPPADGGQPATAADGSHKKEPWFQRRIDQLTAEKWEERRKNETLVKQTEELLSQLAKVRETPPTQAAPVDPAAPPSQTPPAPAVRQVPQLSQAEIEAMVDKRAAEKAQIDSFNKACNQVYESGKEEFSDFDQSLKTFQMLGGIPKPLLDIVTEMPSAHKVLYNLGKDLDLAEKLVKMSPTKMALELARIESGMTRPTPRPVSNAPRPVQPIDGVSRVNEDPEKMDMDAWVKWRSKQLEGRRK